MPESAMDDQVQRNRSYWDGLADEYQSSTRISVTDFHYGPLLAGDATYNLLPEDVNGLRCLELGCGAGQNSIFLSSRGAECVAIDVSEQQLAHAARLNQDHGTGVAFHALAMEQLDGRFGSFDLIHSAYGLPFALDPFTVVQNCANLLNPGGVLLFSMGHPVYAGEWLELDENERGIFLQDYFNPIPDVRDGHQDDSSSWARAFPVSTVIGWVLDAGLQVNAVLEPRAEPVDTFTAEQLQRRVPYFSEDWAEQVQELRKFPIVLVLKASAPVG